MICLRNELSRTVHGYSVSKDSNMPINKVGLSYSKGDTHLIGWSLEQWIANIVSESPIRNTHPTRFRIEELKPCLCVLSYVS